MKDHVFIIYQYLSLWRDWLDVHHVTGDWQDVQLVINDNTVFTGRKRQNESGSRYE